MYVSIHKKTQVPGFCVIREEISFPLESICKLEGEGRKEGFEVSIKWWSNRKSYCAKSALYFAPILIWTFEKDFLSCYHRLVFLLLPAFCQTTQKDEERETLETQRCTTYKLG